MYIISMPNKVVPTYGRKQKKLPNMYNKKIRNKKIKRNQVNKQNMIGKYYCYMLPALPGVLDFADDFTLAILTRSPNSLSSGFEGFMGGTYDEVDTWYEEFLKLLSS